MSIRPKSKGERARKGRTIPRIEEIDWETLELQKSGSNSNNHWSFRCNQQGL